MADKPWKQHERAVAKALGVRRNPNTGEHRSDIDAGPFVIEHKKRKRIPALIVAAMEQAVRAAGDTKTPLVILSEARRGVKAKRFVVLRFEDWLDWYGPSKIPKEAEVTK